MRKQEYTEQERKRRYYFFDYLFWLGEITWENYHKVNFKQPRGSDMLWACIMLYEELLQLKHNSDYKLIKQDNGQIQESIS